MEGQQDDTGRHLPIQGDASRLRASDEDRHRVAEVLRKAAGEGRIDLGELDERLEATYAAKTYADLVPLTADLPLAHLPLAHLPLAHLPLAHLPLADPPLGTTDALPSPPPVAPPAVGPHAGGTVVPATTYESSMSFMGDCSRRGVWRVPETHTAFSVLGSVTLDLREAQFSAREVTVNAYAIMAGIDIIVNPWTQVVVDGVGVMGDFSQSRDKAPAQITPGSPVVHVKGLALMAGVNVKRRPMPGETRKRLRGGR